jgi:hypothetical protein
MILSYINSVGINGRINIFFEFFGHIMNSIFFYLFFRFFDLQSLCHLSILLYSNTNLLQMLRNSIILNRTILLELIIRNGFKNLSVVFQNLSNDVIISSLLKMRQSFSIKFALQIGFLVASRPRIIF